MTLPLSTPGELAEEPELAPLEILQSAVEVSRLALLAAHPELTCRDYVDEEPGISPRQCIAAGILPLLEILAEALKHYRAHLDNLACRHHPGKRADREDDPF